MPNTFESHAFITFLTSPWFFAVVGGFIILGLALAYGAYRTRHRSRLEKLQRDQGTREVYRKDERGERV